MRRRSRRYKYKRRRRSRSARRLRAGGCRRTFTGFRTTNAARRIAKQMGALLKGRKGSGFAPSILGRVRNFVSLASLADVSAGRDV